jgi:ribonuclease P protein component
MVEQNFPKEERLRKRADFTEIFNQGRKTYSSHLILFCRGNGGQSVRVGITASRKVGTAVVRNRVKRLIREYYRQHKSYFTAGIDYSLVVKKSFSLLPKKTAEEQLFSLLKRSDRRSSRC